MKIPEPVEVHIKLGDVVEQIETINEAAKALQALTPDQKLWLTEHLEGRWEEPHGMEHVRAIVKTILEAER